MEAFWSEESTMGLQIGGEIEKVDGNQLSYNEFAEKYLAKNFPVVLTGLMDDWRACKNWVTEDGRPNLEFFSTHFAESTVQVADCGTREFTDQKRIEMTVAQFIDQWVNQNGAGGSSTVGSGQSVLYLKDWHFVKEHPDYVPYKTPLFFCDDWLNLYLDHYRMHNDPDTYRESNEISCSDYRFVYMGAKGLMLGVLCFDLGLLSMPMFSGHTVGQQMFVEGRNGFSSPHRKVISHLTGT
ncbi:unnamed protein product [Linum tenue]|uniref:Uncharacterized protein n=1 Tax=Linum tenue TaxID=586396 RepID=A0AAV0IMA1_9ROSI|nr:unnamed protein product [Linum tenue]